MRCIGTSSIRAQEHSTTEIPAFCMIARSAGLTRLLPVGLNKRKKPLSETLQFLRQHDAIEFAANVKTLDETLSLELLSTASLRITVVKILSQLSWLCKEDKTSAALLKLYPHGESERDSFLALLMAGIDVLVLPTDILLPPVIHLPMPSPVLGHSELSSPPSIFAIILCDDNKSGPSADFGQIMYMDSSVYRYGSYGSQLQRMIGKDEKGLPINLKLMPIT